MKRRPLPIIRKRKRISKTTLVSSCGNSAAGHGQWVRWDLRMADRDTFASFNQQVGARISSGLRTSMNTEASTAVSANDAMATLPDLRHIVNEAKTFEADPLLQSLRKAAQDRTCWGRDPSKFRRQGATKMAKRRSPARSSPRKDLQAVLDAISGLKPIPEADVRDARDPQVGLGLLLRDFGIQSYTRNYAALARAIEGR